MLEQAINHLDRICLKARFGLDHRRRKCFVEIGSDRHASSAIYVPVRELRGRAQTLLLIGLDKGVDSLTSLLSEKLKAAMAEAIREAGGAAL